MKVPAATYRFGTFILNTNDRRLSSEGREVYLRPKTYDTLIYLVEHRGHLVTKHELLEKLWSATAVTDSALARCIKEARAALGDDVQKPAFLRTVPRLGYEFIAEVERTRILAEEELVEEEFRAVRFVTTDEEANDVPRERSGGSESTDVPARKRLLLSSYPRKKMLFLSFIILMLTMVAIAVFIVNRTRNEPLEKSGSPHIESLAVLPLENLTGDTSQEYFADGMTEELITTLGKIKSLRVISRTSVMRYKKTNKPLPEVARDLKVDGIIEGAVMRAGNRIRITVQLIQASTDKHIWSETFNGDAREVLGLQSEVAREIAGQIRADVTLQEQTTLATQRQVDPEAYALYLQGRVLSARNSEASNRAAIAALDRAIAIDPKFAPAYAEIGDAYVDRLFGWEPNDEWKGKAEGAIRKALELDPDLAKAHVSRAALLMTPAYAWQFEKAIQECRRALSVNPNLAEGHLTLGMAFLHVGLLDDSLNELRTAAAISPALGEPGLYQGFSLMFGGKFKDALPFIRNHPVSPFSRSIEAFDLWEMGRREDALSITRALLDRDPQEHFIYLACVHTLLLAGSGQDREVEKRIQEKIVAKTAKMSPYGHFHHFANFVAEIYAQQNKPEESVSWLQKTAETGFPCYPFFEHDRALDPIRQDPHFIAFMQKLKPQWEYLKSSYGQSAPSNEEH